MSHKTRWLLLGVPAAIVGAVLARRDLPVRIAGGIRNTLRPHGSAPDNDRTVADKIRSEVLGAAEYSAVTINVDVVDGIATLRGQLKRPEQINELTRNVGRIPGVTGVNSYLHTPRTVAPNKRDAVNARAT